VDFDIRISIKQMNIYKGPWSDISETVSTAVTSGTFDGVHLGHQQILKQLIQVAKENHLSSTVITFDPHPQELIRSKKPDIRILTDLNEKTAILENLGISQLIVIRFDRELAQLSPRTFVEQVVVNRLKAKWMIIGYDHAFGKDRGGKRDNLISMAKDFGFQVGVVEPVVLDEVTISSTKIRHALYEGNLPLANTYLGRPYSISGVVIPGDTRGRILGIPTVNLKPHHLQKLIPADGVYAGRAWVNSESYLAAISIGDRPTFHAGGRVLEAHLVDFVGDVYGKEIKLEFDRKIRDQIQFASASELTLQMKEDILVIKRMSVATDQMKSGG
jgi:riboflavin kinase/FMN adenylyltransferase